jgi:hypothetical protein
MITQRPLAGGRGREGLTVTEQVYALAASSPRPSGVPSLTSSPHDMLRQRSPAPRRHHEPCIWGAHYGNLQGSPLRLMLGVTRVLVGQGNEECRHDEQGDKQSGSVVHQSVLQPPSGQVRVRGMGERMASDAQCRLQVLAKATTHQAHGQQPMHPKRSPLPSCRHDDRPATVGRQVGYEYGCTRLQAALSGLCQCIRALRAQQIDPWAYHDVRRPLRKVVLSMCAP